MADEFGEKSQEATPHRRQKAREEGQVAKSQDLASAGLLIGTVLIVMIFGASLVNFLGELTHRQLSQTAMLEADVQSVVNEWYVIGMGLARVLLPIFGLVFLVAVVVNMGQVGFMFLPQKLAFDLNRINPLKGLQRLFSVANVMRLAFGIFKVVVVGAVAWWSLWAQRDTILGLSGLALLEVAAVISNLVIWTCLKIGVALTLLAILDYAYQRYKHEQDIRMTSQEVREEMKMLQGDPQILARRRAVQRQLVMQRLGSAVPRADVVVTNPTELAVAIRYEPETMDAPLVVAKGAGLVAQRIRRLALESDIPIVERKELAQALYRDVEVNGQIPAAEYAAVAEVLKYVYELKGVTPPSLRQAA
jgi:flagellar biosynthetic protein FlhB